MTPKEWYEMTIGKSYNTDGAYGYQCWDYFDYFKKYNKLDGMSTYCGLTGYAGDIWKLREKNGASKYFEFVSPANIKEGDWILWNRHVAFYYGGREVGENQIAPKYKVTAMALNRNGILGAFRYKYWTDNKKGTAEKFDKKLSGQYITTDALNLRTGGSTAYPVITVIKKGEKINCYGYYHLENGVKWLYVQAGNNTGFVCSDYVKKVG